MDGCLGDAIVHMTSIPETVLRGVARQVLLGLQYLHKQRHVVHRYASAHLCGFYTDSMYVVIILYANTACDSFLRSLAPPGVLWAGRGKGIFIHATGTSSPAISCSLATAPSRSLVSPVPSNREGNVLNLPSQCNQFFFQIFFQFLWTTCTSTCRIFMHGDI